VAADYFHYLCGGHVFTREQGPFVSGDLFSSSGVTLADGSVPQTGDFLYCRFCGDPIAADPRFFRIHERT
jgi:hypothetical protein